MITKIVMAKLALARCRLGVTHLCAMHHLQGRKEDDAVLRLVQALGRDLAFMECQIEEFLSKTQQ